jgi:hypothetical protein
MNKSRLLGAVCACVLTLTTTITNAATIDFGIEAPTTGTISYAGGAAPLIGAGIDVDSIVGLDTPLNADAPILCDSCSLEFTTGGSTGGWNFSNGGTIDIIGGVADAGIAGDSTLLSGSFNSASVTDIGGGIFNFKIAGASFLDIKHPDLLAYFGLPEGSYQGGLNISFNTIGGIPNTGEAFTSDTLFSGDVINSPVVPVPAAVWLFGSGLLGLIGVARRKKT